PRSPTRTSPQPIDASLAPRFPRAQQHLGIAARRESPAAGRQLVAQVTIVVDLAVEDQRRGPVVTRHRLPPRDEIDDRQPRHPERRLAIEMAPGVGGPATLERPQHRAEAAPAAAARAAPAGDPTHQRATVPAAPATVSRRSSTRAAVWSLANSAARARPQRRRA